MCVTVKGTALENQTMVIIYTSENTLILCVCQKILLITLAAVFASYRQFLPSNICVVGFYTYNHASFIYQNGTYDPCLCFPVGKEATLL